MKLPDIPDGYVIHTVGNLWRSTGPEWHGPIRAMYAQALADIHAHIDRAPLVGETVRGYAERRAKGGG